MTFDELRDHTGAHATKWDAMAHGAGVDPAGGIPMWVADMDFDAPPAVRNAMQQEVSRGYFGYFGNAAPVTQAICGWMAEQHGWPLEPAWVSYTHGVVAGFAQALAAFSDPGDPIVLFTPVYHAFFRKAEAMRRPVLQSELVLRNGRYDMDLDALEAQLTGRERIVVLCSPHNPGGRMWDAAEIAALVALCRKHELILLSDEIHMDLVYPGARHIPTAVAAPDSIDRLVVISAASKGFNLAGGETGFMIVPDKALRDRLAPVQADRGGTPNRFGMVMLKAAFTEAADWNRDVRAYLADNFALWRHRIGALPGIEVMEMSSTYLSWVNFAGTGMSAQDILARIRKDARIAISPGDQFGKGGETFQRFNLALPRPRLLEAIDRMERAFGDLQ